MRRVIWLQIPTLSWLGGGTISLSCWIYMGLIMLGRQKYHVRTTSAWAKCLWIWVGYWKAKKSQISRYYQIPAEMIKAGGRTICCEIHKLIISIWNKKKLPEKWKESIIVPISKKGDKTDCSNYTGISLLPTTFWRNKLPMFQVTSWKLWKYGPLKHW